MGGVAEKLLPRLGRDGRRERELTISRLVLVQAVSMPGMHTEGRSGFAGW